MTDWNLSDKINESAMSIIDGDFVIVVKDVKEFVKRLKKELSDGICYASECTENEIKIIDKLAGDKLI